MMVNKWLKTKNAKIYLTAGILALGLAAALSGCTGTKETDSTEISAPTAPESGADTQESQPSPVRPDGREYEETVKPTEPLPETIPTFPGADEVEEPDNGHGPMGPGGVEERLGDNMAIIGTDIHYLSRELTDGGPGFQYMVEHGDGKVVTYIEQITDAFLEEVIRQKPDVLILSGDLTLDGEKRSHEELAEKLYLVENAGIPVLVIPGNHDINNRHAAQYQGEERFPAEFTTPEEFREIYQDFGYNEAVSEDRISLSYVYEVDEYNRLLMLDTCQYQQKALVGGAILTDTYDWIEEQLEDAWDNGMNIIPVAHHNLLDESEIYVDDCTIEHGEQLVNILENWDVPVFLSGHLHVQHSKRSEDNRGVWEMVTSSLATPACQYGNLLFRDDGSFRYWTQSVDVERWAKRHNRAEKDLLEFDDFKEPFLRRVFYNQSYDALAPIGELNEKQKEQMSELYSELNYHYYQGTAYQIRDRVLKDPDYQLWLEDGAFTILTDYVQYIVSDAKRDYNRVEED